MSVNKIWLIARQKSELTLEDNLIKLLKKNNFKVLTYAVKSSYKKTFHSKKELLLQELGFSLKIFFHIFFHRNERVLTFAAHYSFFLINRLWGWALGNKYHLYVYNFYIHELGEKETIKKILRFLLNSSKITLIVQSPGEVEYYSSLKIKCKILFIPFCTDNKMLEQIDTSLLPHELVNTNYIFCGGYTNRDYPLMLEAASNLPGYKFVFIASSLNEDIDENLPPNVTLYKDVEYNFFLSVMKGSEIILVALKEDVGASGQILSLDSMVLAKPIIYANISSINYYFEGDKTSGIPYEIKNLESLMNAIIKMKSLSEKERKEMGNNAYDNYKNNFTRSSRDEALAKIVTSK